MRTPGTRAWGSRGIWPGSHRNVRFLLENSSLGRDCWLLFDVPLLVSPQRCPAHHLWVYELPDCKSIFNLCAPRAVIHLQLQMKNPQRTCQPFLDLPQHSAGHCLGLNWHRFAVGWTLKRWEMFGKKQSVLPQLLLQGTTITEATRQNNLLHTLSYFCVKPHLICCSILHALYLIHFLTDRLCSRKLSMIKGERVRLGITLSKQYSFFCVCPNSNRDSKNHQQLDEK